MSTENDINPLCTKGAAQLAQMIRSGEAMSAEVVDAHLARIAEVNPALNAVTVADEARGAAAAVASGAPLDAAPPQLAEAAALWYQVMAADFFGAWPGMEPIAGAGALEFIPRIQTSGVSTPVDQAGQAAAWIARHALGAAWAQFSQEHPVVLAPDLLLDAGQAIEERAPALTPMQPRVAVET